MTDKPEITSSWGLLALLIITGTCSVMLISHLMGAGLLHLNISDPGLLIVDGLLSLIGLVWALSVVENGKSPEVKAKEAQAAAQEAYNNAYANEDPMKPLPRLYPVNYLIAWSAIVSALEHEPIFVGGQPQKWTVNTKDREGAKLEAYFVHGIEPNVTTLCLTARFVQLEPGTRVIFEFHNQSVLAPTDGKKLITITLDNIIGVMSQAFPPGGKCIVEVPEYKESAHALRAAEWKPGHDAQVGILTVITLVGLLVGAGWWTFNTFFQSKPAEQSSQVERVEPTPITTESTNATTEPTTTSESSTTPAISQPAVPVPATSDNLSDERPLADAAVREYLALAANGDYRACKASTTDYQGNIDPAQYPKLWQVLPSSISTSRIGPTVCLTMVVYDDAFTLQFDTTKDTHGIWKVHSILPIAKKPDSLVPDYAKPIAVQQPEQQQTGAVPQSNINPQAQFDPNSQVDPGLEIHGRPSIATPEGIDSNFKQRLPADKTLPAQMPNAKFAMPPEQDWELNAARRNQREQDPSGVHPMQP
ncbi:MAG: hypothetical protein K2W95_12240 [Candidatus Obscuribacterales bacterium]|nr:hypothetical protein [Candidatus Obscuribacterales bacterium]